MKTEEDYSSQKYNNLRRAFFTDGEIENLTEIMLNPGEKAIQQEVSGYKTTKIYKHAMELIEQVESGKFNEDEMPAVEYTLAHLLAVMENSDPKPIPEPIIEL